MRYELLYEISKPVIAAVGVSNVLNAIVESTAKGTGAKGCSLLTLTPDRRQLVHRVTYGLSEEYLSKGELLVGLTEEEVLAGKTIAIHDAQKDKRVQYPEETAHEGIVSILSLPMRTKKEVKGILRLYFGEPRRFKKGEIDFLESIAELSGIVLEKAEQHELATRNVVEARKEIAKLSEERKSFIHFLSMVAHDLKAPLAAVESYLKVMLRGSTGELNEKQAQWIKRSIQRIDGMLELISDLLDISRLETGQIATELQTVSWSKVLENSIEMARSLAGPRGIKVMADIKNDLPDIFASEIRLSQLINNLVSNACRYTPKGGHIYIRARVEENEVVVSVEDEGTGIDPEIMPRIFEDFFKGADSPEGTGLGLSICKRIVELHQGRIWAESPVPETGKGARFTFAIPLGATCKISEWNMLKEGEK
jgi:signal transduction histidine kinase